MSRLTKKDSSMKTYMHIYSDENKQFVVYDLCQKLGKIEDLMEKYDINDLVELEIALDYYKHRYDNVQTRKIDNNE